MGATAAHRAPERMADGMRTQVWAWMTNKCWRRMNEGEGYIYIYIYNSRDLLKGKGTKRRREAPEKGEELGTHILERGVLSP